MPQKSAKNFKKNSRLGKFTKPVMTHVAWVSLGSAIAFGAVQYMDQDDKSSENPTQKSATAKTSGKASVINNINIPENNGKALVKAKEKENPGKKLGNSKEEERNLKASAPELSAASIENNINYKPSSKTPLDAKGKEALPESKNYKDHHFMIPIDSSFPLTDYTVSLEFKTSDQSFALFSIRDEQSAHDREIWYQDGSLFHRLWKPDKEETIEGTVGGVSEDQWNQVSVTIDSHGGNTLYFNGSEVAKGKIKTSKFDWATDLHIGYVNTHQTGSPNDFQTGGIRNVEISDFTGQILGNWPINSHEETPNLEDQSTYQNNAIRVPVTFKR